MYSEETLLKELKADIIRKVYYFYGKETFLVETYAKKVLAKCGEVDSFNKGKFSGDFNVSAFAEFAESFPMFGDKRVAMVNDFDVEKMNESSVEMFTAALRNLPETTCVIIYQTGITPDLKKAKTKKFIAFINGLNKSKKSDAVSAVLGFERLSELKTGELIGKRVARLGCNISRENAGLLARLCLRNLTMIACETDKLCAYMGYTGTISASVIEKLTARQFDSSVFSLANEITAKRGASALKLLNELIEQGNVPIVIMSSLSMTFIDFYRVKIASVYGKHNDAIIKDFKYAANRAWVINKAATAAARLNLQKIRDCVTALCDADFKLKSSPVDSRLIMESTIVKLLTLC